MYEYVNFCCAWPTYFIDSYTDGSGNVKPGYYLYASDAVYMLTTDGAQYNYGYKDGYFDDIIKRIRAVDETAFEDLVKNVENAKALAERALKELFNGEYTSQRIYVEKFGVEDDVYTLNKGTELQAAMDELYLEYSNWLGSWEL